MPRGRKTILTPELQDKICQAIKAGNYIDTACNYVDINQATYFRCILIGENQKKGQYYDFCEAVARARAEAEIRAVTIIAKAMPDSWQAAVWWLERTRPAKWGRREKLELEHSGSVKSPLVMQMANQIIVDPSVRSLISQLLPKLLPNSESSATVQKDEAKAGRSADNE